MEAAAPAGAPEDKSLAWTEPLAAKEEACDAYCCWCGGMENKALRGASGGLSLPKFLESRLERSCSNFVPRPSPWLSVLATGLRCICAADHWKTGLCALRQGQPMSSWARPGPASTAGLIRITDVNHCKPRDEEDKHNPVFLFSC